MALAVEFTHCMQYILVTTFCRRTTIHNLKNQKREMIPEFQKCSEEGMISRGVVHKV